MQSLTVNGVVENSSNENQSVKAVTALSTNHIEQGGHYQSLNEKFDNKEEFPVSSIDIEALKVNAGGHNTHWGFLFLKHPLLSIISRKTEWIFL